jgi:hypothetical protein
VSGFLSGESVIAVLNGKAFCFDLARCDDIIIQIPLFLLLSEAFLSPVSCNSILPRERIRFV